MNITGGKATPKTYSFKKLGVCWLTMISGPKSPSKMRKQSLAQHYLFSFLKPRPLEEKINLSKGIIKIGVEEEFSKEIKELSCNFH